MKKTTKSMLVAIPLALGLSIQAAPALAESSDTGGSNGTAASIDSLFNQYAGLLPGDKDMAAVSQEITQSQQLSAYTNAATSMNTGFTNQGVDRSAPNQPSHADDYNRSNSTGANNGSEREAAAAPGTTPSSSIRLATESLSAVAGGITPSGSTGSPIYPVAETQQAVAIPQGDNVSLTTTIIPNVTTPVPLPAAVVLFGSGLAALASLRKRTDEMPIQLP